MKDIMDHIVEVASIFIILLLMLFGKASIGDYFYLLFCVVGYFLMRYIV